MLNRNINSIIYQSYIKLGELTYEIAKKSEEGFTGTKALDALWRRAIHIDNLLFTIVENAEVVDNEVYRVVGVPDSDVNKMLSCLESLSGIRDYPVAPFLVSRNVTKLHVAGEGTTGAPGSNGVSCYNAVVFATDAIGTGMSTSPSPTRPYIAFKTSTNPIPITPATFQGLWVKYIGDPGLPGEDGADGTNYYFYVRYASDTGGTGFSATPTQARKYVGFLSTTVDQLNNPPATAFTGLWMKYIGEDGLPGTPGTNGKTILCLDSPPTNDMGSDGDVAIDTTNWFIYAPKASGVWPPGVSMVGPQGPPGTPGVDGEDGEDGADAFLYIAWADNAAGLGFTMVFDPNKQWIATLSTTVEISTPVVADFAGRWAKYRGDGDNWATFSATSMLISAGTKSLIVGTGLAYTTGQRIVIAVNNDPLNRMEGLCVAYNQVTGQMTALITHTYGSGTHNSWSVNLQGVPIAAPTSDSYYAEIYTDVGAGTQDTSTSYAKLAQFDVNGDANNGMVPDHVTDTIISSVAGEFAIYANLTLASIAGGTFIFQIAKDGVAIPGIKGMIVLPASSVPATLSLKGIRAITETNVCEVQVKATSGTPDIILLSGAFGMYTTGTPSTPEYSLFGGTFNTGLSVVDSFPANLGDSVIWHYKIKKGNNVKTGTIQGAWDSLNNITEIDNFPIALGTIDVVLSVDVSGGNVNLKATLTSDGWEISGNRYILI